MELLEQHFEATFAAPDGIKKLRELILTLALRGKLVYQDPKDQTASELLKKIEAEKKRLVKQGKIREPKPLPPLTPEEIPYEIPNTWEWVRLGTIAAYNGRDNANPNEIAKDSWVLDLEDIEKISSRLLYRATYSERESKSTKSCFKAGDVLYGKLRPYLDKVLVADREGFCTTELVPIVPYCLVDPHFLRWALKSPLFLAYVNSLMYGVKMPRLGTEDAITSIHPLPPFEEQRRIVAKIDELMARCDALEKLREEREAKRLAVHTAAVRKLLNVTDAEDHKQAREFLNQHFGELHTVKENVAELRKAILQLAVMGKLVPQDPKDLPATKLLDEIEAAKTRLTRAGKIKKPKPLTPIDSNEVPYPLPAGWMWCRLGEALDVRDGTHDTPKYVKVGYPLVTSKNIYSGTLDLENVSLISEEDHRKISERSRVDKGDILFAMIGSIGNPVIVDSDAEFSIKNVALFKYFEKDKPNNKYLSYFLVHAQHEMRAKSSGAVQSFVSLGFLRNYLIPLPPLVEQHRIVTEIDQLMSLCDALEQYIDAAGEKQSALLNAWMAQIGGQRCA